MVYSYVEDNSRKEFEAQRIFPTISLNFRNSISPQHQNVGEQENNFDAFASHHFSLLPTLWPLKPL